MRHNKTGFTLIELLITITILGILAAISIPLYVGQQRKAAMSEAQTNLQNLRLLLEQNFADQGCYYRLANVCTDANFIGIAAIQPVYPRFRPGLDQDLNYTYEVRIPATATATRAVPPVGALSFTLFARPKAGRIVANTEPFWLNDLNEGNIR